MFGLTNREAARIKDHPEETEKVLREVGETDPLFVTDMERS
jgi:hypothetical protein